MTLNYADLYVLTIITYTQLRIGNYHKLLWVRIITATDGTMHSIGAIPVGAVAVADAVTRLAAPVGACYRRFSADKIRFAPVKQPGQTNQPCR